MGGDEASGFERFAILTMGRSPKQSRGLMRRLVYHCASSIDGFVALENGTFDCFAMEGPHVDDFIAKFSDYDTALMGRRTYEVGLAAGVTNPYPTMKTYVFSRTMKHSPHEAVTIVSENAEQLVRELKGQEGKDLWLVGAGDLASTLLAAGLIDEVCIKLNPIVMAKGIPVVARTEAPLSLDLVESKTYDNGVVLLTYGLSASP